jgi:hypothetical protein
MKDERKKEEKNGGIGGGKQHPKVPLVASAHRSIRRRDTNPN